MVNIWLLLGLTAAMVSLKLNSLDGAESGKSLNVGRKSGFLVGRLNSASKKKDLLEERLWWLLLVIAHMLPPMIGPRGRAKWCKLIPPVDEWTWYASVAEDTYGSATLGKIDMMMFT